MTDALKRNNIKLTDKKVKDLRPTGGVLRVWDQTVPGFLVRITETGRKSYCVAFQRADGKKVNATLGDCNSHGIEEAREWARRLRVLHDNGIDIRAHHIEKRKPQDLNGLIKIWEADYKPSLKASTRTACASRVKLLQASLGSRLVKDLALQDVKDLHNQVLLGEGGKRHPVNANRVVAMLSRLLTIAENEGWRQPGLNPCRQFGKSAEKARSRIFSAAELAKLESAMKVLIKRKKLDPNAGDLVRFLALSGLRRGEAEGLMFKDVDLDRKLMRFDDHKTADKAGVKILPLNHLLLLILRRWAKLKLSPYVWLGRDPEKPLVGLPKMWDRIVLEAKLKDVTVHDLRRTFMSVCTELGYPMTIGDMLLGHSLGKVRDTYVNLGTEGLLGTASTDTANWIAAAMAGKKPKPGVKVSRPGKASGAVSNGGTKK